MSIVMGVYHIMTFRLLVIDHHPDQGRGAGLVSLYPVYESGCGGGSLMSSWCYLPRTHLCTHMCLYYQVINNGASPALIAACNGHEQTVRMLAELNADLNQVTREFLLHV